MFTRTKKVQELILRILNHTWFYSKTKFGRKRIQIIKTDNENKAFLNKQKLIGVIFFFISLIALFILIRKWEDFF